jgi:AbrB family looped-hinge helix DNA binding protein
VTRLTITSAGQITLPTALRARYGLTSEQPLRVIETRNGILLVPLTDAPMDQALRQELEEWQALSVSAWEMFPYEEPQS